MIDDVVDILMRVFIGLAFLFAFYVFLVLAPVSAYADAKCLEAGYPKSSVTWNLDSYCLGLDGATKTEVRKLP